MIEIDSLSHAIEGTPILTDITLTLPKGGITALIGPNGAGKSTLLSLIARLIPAQTGRVTVDGLGVATSDTGDLAKRLAILPQIHDAAPRLTIADLVAFGRYPHSRGRLTATDLDAVDHAIATFGLGNMRSRTLDSLSGGQRQKALLAMIFAQDTDYLLLDEPLNNLDIAGARNLMAELRKVAEAHGRTIIIVLHDIAYALAYADHVVVLSEGRLVAEGPPQDVVTEALLKDVYGTQVALHRIGDRVLVDVG